MALQITYTNAQGQTRETEPEFTADVVYRLLRMLVRQNVLTEVQATRVALGRTETSATIKGGTADA